MRYNMSYQRQAERNLAVYLKEWHCGISSFFPPDLAPTAFAEYLLERLFSVFRCVYSPFQAVESHRDPFYQGSCAAIVKYLNHDELLVSDAGCTQVAQAIFQLTTQVYCYCMFTSDLTGYRDGISGPCALLLITGPHKESRTRYRPAHHREPYVRFRPFDEKLGMVEIDERWFLVEEVPHPGLDADSAIWHRGVHLLGEFLLEDAIGTYHWACRYRFLEARDASSYGLDVAPGSYINLHEALFALIERAYQEWVQKRSA